MLAARFPTGDPHVEVADVGTVLMSSSLDALWENHPALHAEAQQLVEQLNGVALLLYGGYRPVRALSTYYGADGSVHGLAQVEVGGRVTAVAPAGPIPGQLPRPDGPSYLAAARRSPDLSEVLALLGGPELGTDRMWKVYEIVRANHGGPNASAANSALQATGWLTPDQLASLRQAINNPDMTGPAARHARHTPTSATPINLDQARSLLLQLVERWARTL